MKRKIIAAVINPKKPFFSIFLVGVFFLLYLFILDFFASSPYVFNLVKYPTPSMDSTFPELDVKLQRFWKIEGVNCLFLGSSMVDTGLEPRVFEEELNRKLGTNYRCFNFGFSSSMVEVSGSIGNTIQHKQPIDLIVWGISPIDMDPNFTTTRPIAKMPAFAYFNGNPSFTGWLYNNFSLPWILGSLPHLQNGYYKRVMDDYDKALDDRGVRRLKSIGKISENPPPIFLPGYNINKVDLDVLENTIRESKELGVDIIFVEMPVHHTLSPYLVDNGVEGYQEKFLIPIKDFFKRHDVPFIESQENFSQLVEDSHWVNNYHLNIHGAKLFTEYILSEIDIKGFLP